jgi:hypothetical protein
MKGIKTTMKNIYCVHDEYWEEEEIFFDEQLARAYLKMNGNGWKIAIPDGLDETLGMVEWKDID